jgi:hypothetical protein
VEQNQLLKSGAKYTFEKGEKNSKRFGSTFPKVELIEIE